MSTYLTDPFIKVVENYLESLDWYQDPVMKEFGTFSLPIMLEENETVQLNTIIAQAADILHSTTLDFPEVAKSELAMMYRIPFYFAGKIDLSAKQWNDLNKGSKFVANSLKEQIKSLKFNWNKDIRNMFLTGMTSGTDLDYHKDWKPFANLQSAASDDINNPQDMNGKAGGTSGTRLDLTAAVMWSSTTNMTIDFPNALLGSSIEAFEAFEDSKNGRRMVALDQSGVGQAQYLLTLHPVIISWMKRSPIYNGEFVDRSMTVYEDITKRLGVKIVPDPSETYSTAEDGEFYFKFFANPKRNFQVGEIEGTPKAPIWSEWAKTGSGIERTIGREKGCHSRLVPFSYPYHDGSAWFKAVVIGKATFKNDAG